MMKRKTIVYIDGIIFSECTLEKLVKRENFIERIHVY